MCAWLETIFYSSREPINRLQLLSVLSKNWSMLSISTCTNHLFVTFYDHTQSSWACHNWMMSRNQGLNVFWRQQKTTESAYYRRSGTAPEMASSKKSRHLTYMNPSLKIVLVLSCMWGLKGHVIAPGERFGDFLHDALRLCVSRCCCHQRWEKSIKSRSKTTGDSAECLWMLIRSPSFKPPWTHLNTTQPWSQRCVDYSFTPI